MKVTIDQKIVEKYHPSVLAFSFKLDQDTIQHIQAKSRHLFEKLQLQNYSDYKLKPEIKRWREIFKDFNVDPNYKSSVENLMKNYKDGKFPEILPLVDYFNLISIDLECAVGLADLDLINEKHPSCTTIEIRYGKENQFITDFRLKEHKVTPEHIVYGIQDSIMTWLWCYRESKDYVVSKDSKNIIVIVDILSHDTETINTKLKEYLQILPHLKQL